MAKALECPACGARHSLESLPDARTFRCDRCGQVLKVPESIDAGRGATGAPAPTASGSAAASAPASSGPPPPPPRRGGSAAPTGARVSATATATMPATAAATAPATATATADTGSRRDRRATPRTRVHWYWRILAWIVAVPLGLLITGWPALQLDLLDKDDLLDVFVGEGSGRYVRLLVFAAAWALVTALLVQLFVEGGRWWSRRRRAKAGTSAPVPV